MYANLLVIFGTVVIPLVVISFVCVVTFVNFYLNIRRRFPAKVNCWFCNHDSHVPYDQSNSFMCPSCKQYNGFTADGDYNREIPEQYQQRKNCYYQHQPLNITDDDKWDKSTVRSVASQGPFRNNNGLCFGCNRNQELKIHQLASFVPEDEDNYETEVEEYRKQLEQAYKLCGRCERVLKRTLNDVKRNILGSKLSQIGSKSLNVLDMHMRISAKQIVQQKRQKWAKLCVWAVSSLLLIKLYQDFSNSNWTVTDLMMLCPKPLLTGITMVFSYVLATRALLWRQFELVLSEPTVQQTTDRIQSFGDEIFHHYVPQLVQTSAHYFDSMTNQTQDNANSSLLLNFAIVALASLLVSLGNQRTVIKQIIIVVFCLADIALKYIQYQESSIPICLLTVTSLGLSLSCIGQRLIRCGVPTSNLNSSFHKIYSQQCRETDYTDNDTTASEQSFVLEQNTTNEFPITANTDITPNAHRFPKEPPTSIPNICSDKSRQSLDTTKSGSPSNFSVSPTNPFFMPSFTEGQSPTRLNKMSGSLFNVTTGEVGRSAMDNDSIFKQRNIAQNNSGYSLLKTPSFSVDNFQTMASKQSHRYNYRLSGPPSVIAGSHRDRDFNRHRYSMNTINQEEDRSFRLEDPLIEDDIDRLSISGRASLNTSGLLGSPMWLGHNNPFAQMKTIEQNKEQEVAQPSSSLRQRRFFRPPEPLAKDLLWTGLSHTGDTGNQQTQMSRTSSQSSGFESQAGTTRRNTPTESDVPSGCVNGETPVGAGNFIISPRNEQPSPVPSSASMFERNTIGTSFGNHRQDTSQQRSLFNEQNLFNNALQMQSSAVGGLFFPKISRTSTVSNTSGSTASSVASYNTRHIFAPQQSKTPSYHHQYNHSPIGGPMNAAQIPSETFGTLGFINKTSSLASLTGNSFFTSAKSTARGTPSLLNLSKLTNEIDDGPLPTA
ncbi:uncharacterized protein LOC128730777 [Anopheles nili]|uniref:uncharacterized protein LOC128730777 n=1 Tax=Anopheles nili TaxID=185578 RepID=UPI00237A3882|nr:uncharacterized protein LOC128730777 [Anopheles nili]